MARSSRVWGWYLPVVLFISLWHGVPGQAPFRPTRPFTGKTTNVRPVTTNAGTRPRTTNAFPRTIAYVPTPKPTVYVFTTPKPKPTTPGTPVPPPTPMPTRKAIIPIEPVRPATIGPVITRAPRPQPKTIPTTLTSPHTTPTTLTPSRPQVTDAQPDGAVLTGQVCVRVVTETRPSWQTVTFACQRQIVVLCYECQYHPNCQFLNTSHCEKKEAGSCSAQVYQYQPVDVTIRECCNGFEAIENVCKRIQACENGNGGCSQLCRKNNEIGLYCECFNGYQIDESKKSCIDWNECGFRNGGCSHTCTNTLGSYYCSCPVGYKLISPTECEEVNECEDFNGGCAQKCINIVGRHYCECFSGYRLQDGDDCIDIDECVEEFRCGFKCHNFPGTFICSCPENEVLMPDNRTCTGSEYVQAKASASHLAVFSTLPMIATLSAVGAIVLIVLIIWIICCYLKGPCWCCATSSSKNIKRQRNEAIDMQDRRRSGKPPSGEYYNTTYTDDTSEMYNTHARRPNGLPEKEFITQDDIHILSE